MKKTLWNEQQALSQAEASSVFDLRNKAILDN